MDAWYGEFFFLNIYNVSGTVHGNMYNFPHDVSRESKGGTLKTINQRHGVRLIFDFIAVFFLLNFGGVSSIQYSFF